MKAITQIRSTGLSKINRLQRAAVHLDVLRPAFAQWQAGEIYVCKKTGTYRFRFGEQSKSVTPWSGVAAQLFGDPAAFAFAAMVLGADAPPAPSLPASKPAAALPAPARRVDVVALAEGGAR